MHISIWYALFSILYCLIVFLGFLNGDQATIIPWGSLMKDPTSWIEEECIPDGFEWRDPSKIPKEEVFHLLDHWRAHQAQGLKPLIWVPTCPLFQNTERLWSQGGPSNRLELCSLLQSLMKKYLSFQTVMTFIQMMRVAKMPMSILINPSMTQSFVNYNLYIASPIHNLSLDVLRSNMSAGPPISIYPLSCICYDYIFRLLLEVNYNKFITLTIHILSLHILRSNMAAGLPISILSCTIHIYPIIIFIDFG